MTTTTVLTEPEFTATVVAKKDVAEATVALDLERADGGTFPLWSPGAHIDLVLRPEGGEEMIRQYSLCSDPTDTSCWRVGVLNDPNSRGGSAYIHTSLEVGDEVLVRGPRNHFSLVSSDEYIFVAGGIGITPMLPMAAQAQAAGATWSLIYSARHRADMSFLDELAQYGDKVTLWESSSQGRFNPPEALGSPRAGVAVYVCGPEGLLDSMEEACAPWPDDTLHLERFAGKEIDASGDTPFEIVLERSGKTLQVPADRSIIEVCQDNGVPVLMSCSTGVCGTCETEIIEGEADHRDSVLDESDWEANEVMMICVSRCKGDRLVLDL